MEKTQDSPQPSQIRSARALLGWSQRELARRAQLGTSTVADFERGARAPTTNNIQAMVKALEEGGVVFTGQSVTRRTTITAPVRPVAGRTPSLPLDRGRRSRRMGQMARQPGTSARADLPPYQGGQGNRGTTATTKRRRHIYEGMGRSAQ